MTLAETRLLARISSWRIMYSSSLTFETGKEVGHLGRDMGLVKLYGQVIAVIDPLTRKAIWGCSGNGTLSRPTASRLKALDILDFVRKNPHLRSSDVNALRVSDTLLTGCQLELPLS